MFRASKVLPEWLPHHLGSQEPNYAWVDALSQSPCQQQSMSLTYVVWTRNLTVVQIRADRGIAVNLSPAAQSAFSGLLEV